ncbi:Glyoxalase/bleomycin resistance protein/dioxygenase [Methylocella tundrae]|uniref:Glyoxalase/bleomycin resistance protein/dioxygenase n=1 Tax=Methylocella tundrae TaxID=227605 RepID=A0A8B6M8N8_METTU|nr:VOC family protein [Methylocella tundrae]VTZ26803.1 Glyoxalase [Methylocella tundrae]VTZ51168.1 Glyoxalase/bleomycin resistance protein/dioxygenase [Methylocella tundrae]
MVAVTDVAFVRYSAPDLDRMEAFLLDFGLLTAARSPDALYMRGYGSAPFIHVTERGPEASLGMGFFAASAADLEELAKIQGRTIEANTEPGGGIRVRLTDPAGFQVDVIHGFEALASVPHRSPIRGNTAFQPNRQGETVRVSLGPAHVERLGHLVLRCPDFAASLAFYTDVLGFKHSDRLYDGLPDNTVAVFLHCGLGERWTDHHTLAVTRSRDGRAGFGHSAFEVTDLDDLVQGGAYLETRGRTHSWGVGRHIQGSQVFDYWRDPFRNQVEHWTDGDLVNDSTPVSEAQMGPNELYQWGPDVPADFFEPGPSIKAGR